MCEIYYIKKTGENANQFLQQNKQAIIQTLKNSYAINNDGAGYLYINNGDKYEVKKVYKHQPSFINQIYSKMLSLNNSDQLIVHFRASTSGFSHKNTQPIEKNKYIVIHNGILTNSLNRYDDYDDDDYDDNDYNDNWIKNNGTWIQNGVRTRQLGFNTIKSNQLDKSDTMLFTEKLEKTSNIIKALEGFFGSYSMFIYSKKTKKLYYTKNESTNFAFKYDKDNQIVIGATREHIFNMMNIKIGAFVKQNDNIFSMPIDNTLIYQLPNDFMLE